MILRGRGRRILIYGQLQQKHEALSEEQIKSKRTGSGTQVVHETLGSTQYCQKPKKV
jgi:hypothetical protein